MDNRLNSYYKDKLTLPYFTSPYPSQHIVQSSTALNPKDLAHVTLLTPPLATLATLLAQQAVTTLRLSCSW